MNNHTEFILSPITDILKGVVSATSGIAPGIETFPLYDYITQSVFLKMTGYQEQKLKCIFWEMATNDYEYRYKFTRNPNGECSEYKEKSRLYKEINELIESRNPGFDPVTYLNKSDTLTKVKQDILLIFNNTNMSIWTQRSFDEFIPIWNEIRVNNFATNSNDLLSEISSGISLKKIFVEHIYVRRNRLAHNTQSYQQNLPTLKTLMSESYKYENYFLHIATLILIDNIFVKLYRKFLESLDNN